MLKPVRRNLLLAIAPAWATGVVAVADGMVAGLALHGAGS